MPYPLDGVHPPTTGYRSIDTTIGKKSGRLPILNARSRHHARIVSAGRVGMPLRAVKHPLTSELLAQFLE